MKPLRVFEAFAGVGSQRMALRNIGINHEVVAIAEIDKYAIKSYMAIHGQTNNVGDISQLSLSEIPDHDLFTYSFPCQDISVAGHKNGLSEGSGSRSSLLWECKRVIEGKRPKYLLLENVKNLVGKQNKPDFDKWLKWLTEQGYTNYWKVLNAKEYGIPQNRERVFVVSILEDGQLEMFNEFEFPAKELLTDCLGDLLEHEVDSKYYVSETMLKGFTKHNENHEDKGTGFIWKPRDTNGIASCLRANGALCPTDNTIIVEGRIEGCGTFKHDQSKRVYNPHGLAPTIHTSGGGGQHTKIIEDTKVRRLTPRESWRLMGFSDADFDKVRFQSDTQLYKQAGNSIVVPVLEAIFRQLFKGMN